MNQHEVNDRNSQSFIFRLAASFASRLDNRLLVKLYQWIEGLLYEREALQRPKYPRLYGWWSGPFENETEEQYVTRGLNISVPMERYTTRGLSDLECTYTDACYASPRVQDEASIEVSDEDQDFHCEYCSMLEASCTCSSCPDCGCNINECRCDPDYFEDMNLEDIF